LKYIYNTAEQTTSESSEFSNKQYHLMLLTKSTGQAASPHVASKKHWLHFLMLSAVLLCLA